MDMLARRFLPVSKRRAREPPARVLLHGLVVPAPPGLEGQRGHKAPARHQRLRVLTRAPEP